jgi:hypothetical protein
MGITNLETASSSAFPTILTPPTYVNRTAVSWALSTITLDLVPWVSSGMSFLLVWSWGKELSFWLRRFSYKQEPLTVEKFSAIIHPVVSRALAPFGCLVVLG